jgi:hypothetical protein
LLTCPRHVGRNRCAWPEREVSSLPSLFPRLPSQAAQERYLSSYAQPLQRRQRRHPGCRERLSWRELSGPAELDRARLSQPDLLPRGRQRRPLRGVGAAATFQRRSPRELQIPTLGGEGGDGHTVCPSSYSTAEMMYPLADLSTVPLTGWSTRIQERHA